MTPKRKFSRSGYIHIYHITVDRGVCFYSVADCLVWFTMLCILAIKYDVQIIAVCIMLNHFHIEARFSTLRKMSLMMQELDSWFTRVYNKQYGRKGPLFDGKYGSAVKLKEQKIRENFIYICNNPVVKKAVVKASDYRWNFLAYMVSENPFSKRVSTKKQSRKLRCVLLEVENNYKSGYPIGYRFFQGLYNQLEIEEKKLVIDRIISLYNVVDYQTLCKLWGDFGRMCKTLATVWGAEYDLADDNTIEDYRRYYKMIRFAGEIGIDLARGCPEEKMGELARTFRDKIGASKQEIAKLLHCPVLELYGIQ